MRSNLNRKLDFAGISGQMQFQVNPLQNNFYAAWRTKITAFNFLRDENFPTERLLQAIWQHQRLRRRELKTADGKTVRIFHPGFVSVEGGPDFRGAVLRIGDDVPRSGDIEIDLNANGWHAHGHDKNPAFKNVLLQVIWQDVSNAVHGRLGASPDKAHPPVLSLQNVLDAPLTELSTSLERESLRSVPEACRGRCSSLLRSMNESDSLKLLNEAADVRFQNKAAQAHTRAKEAGWEQTLWENLFRALGYKQNVWPMQGIAETRGRWSIGADSTFQLQTRLLGVSNLLPQDLMARKKEPDDYLRRAWDFWWRERDSFADCALPRTAWKFHGLRPANHPQRRLALASHWLMQKAFIPRIERWIASDIEPKHFQSSLCAVLQVEHDDFWSWHWTFNSARLKRPRPLLGDGRTTDLAVNVILPWLWIRARQGSNKRIQREVERRYSLWPAAEDNSVLKLARQRLLGTSNQKLFRTATAQQGLIQIVRDFCEHSNAACDDCRLPELLQQNGVL